MEKFDNIPAEKTQKVYSEIYYIIRKEAEETWPQWKKETYNANFATSAHAKKLAINE